MKKSKEQPYIDFYSSRGIIPTRQDISNFKKHLQRRHALYYHLGIAPRNFKDATVLEIGPGSGHNAVVTALLKPKLYLFVDGNKASLESTQKLLRQYTPHLSFELLHQSILDYRSKEKFDIVIAEGIIPAQKKPLQFFQQISEFTDMGGILMISTNDYISVLPEMMRRWQAWHLKKQFNQFEETVEFLANFYLPDIQSLQGMSRLPKDWVTDQLMHPWNGPLFSIPDAVQSLKRGWVFLGGSPRFIQDWRWYKSIHGKDFGENQVVIDQYYQYAHHLLDYRYEGQFLPKESNRRLEKISKVFYQKVFQQELHGVQFTVQEMTKILNEIILLIKPVMKETSKSLESFKRQIQTPRGIKSHVKGLSTLWGRGQQYLSFVRQPAELL